MREELEAVNQISLEMMNRPESRKLGLLIWLLVGAIDMALGCRHHSVPDEYLSGVISHLKYLLDDDRW